MTDSDIKKSLGCYRNSKIIQVENGVISIGDILDLINRQQAEIERYERESQSEFDKWKILDDRTKQRYAELYEEAKDVVKAKAIKEFADRLLHEIQEAILSNDKVISERVERHNANRYEDDLCIMCDGKLMALGGIRHFIIELVKEKVGKE